MLLKHGKRFPILTYKNHAAAEIAFMNTNFRFM